MAELVESQRPQDDLSVHPALRAWHRLNLSSPAAGEISVLRNKRSKAATYRIERLGPQAAPIVAKCCQHEAAAHERVIYEQILPKLPVTTPRYYGFVEGDGGYDWLFLEYVKGEPYSRERSDHAVLAGRWLALLHTSAERVAPSTYLPQLHAGHYCAQLASALEQLSGNLIHLHLPPEELAVVRVVIQQCKFLESHWDQVERWCDQMPRTLVHGDFKTRNVVIRRSGKRRIVLPFDWEASGWGVPAEDLAYIDVSAYHSVSRHFWPELKMRDLVCMKRVGRILRGLSEFCWESMKFNPQWEVSAVKLRAYCTGMAEAIATAKWDE